MVSMWAEPELAYKANQKMAADVKAKTGGRVQIETFSSGSLMPYTEYFDAARAGVVDLVQAGGAYWGGKDQALNAVNNAPIQIGDWPRTFAWVWEHGGINLAREAYAKWDLFYIGHCAYTYAGESIITKKPIRTLDDCKNLKIRAPESFAAVWKGLGANVLTIPGAEVYTALSTGLVDAADWSSPAANYRLKFHEVAKYYSKPGDYYLGGLCDFFMRMDKWNALPDDIKAIMIDAGKNQAFDMWTMTSYDDLTSIEKLKAAGCEMVPWDSALVAKMRELIRETTKNDAYKTELGKKVYDNVAAYLKMIEG